MQPHLNSQALLLRDRQSQLSSASLLQMSFWFPIFFVPLISFVPAIFFTIPLLAAIEFVIVQLSIAITLFHRQFSEINA
jgi:hypothetical protein